MSVPSKSESRDAVDATEASQGAGQGAGDASTWAWVPKGQVLGRRGQEVEASCWRAAIWERVGGGKANLASKADQSAAQKIEMLKKLREPLIKAAKATEAVASILNSGLKRSQAGRRQRSRHARILAEEEETGQCLRDTITMLESESELQKKVKAERLKYPTPEQAKECDSIYFGRLKQQQKKVKKEKVCRILAIHAQSLFPGSTTKTHPREFW